MKTGAELKARRLELGITLHDLAGNAGISRTQLSRMENGKIEIPSEIMEILCDLLYAKHEKPKLKFSDLEVGDYVYVRDDLVDGEEYGGVNFYSDTMKKGRLIKVDGRYYGKEIYARKHYYTPEMIDLSRSMKKEDYLKMNEKEGVSFDDLIDVSTKAFKDGVLYQSSLVTGRLDYKPDFNDENTTVFDDPNYNFKFHIDRIQSLYTEEFVIECEEDILRINSDAITTMQNGHVFHGNEFLEFSGIGRYGLESILKGATVKQKK